MKKVNEIGSVFWLSNDQLDMTLNDVEYKVDFLNDNLQQILTSSGRGAIKHLLNNLNVEKVALLPNFTCHSVVTPFIDKGYQVYFYRIKEDLTIDLNDLLEAVKKHSPKILYLQDYFGFDTLSNLTHYYKQFQSQNITIVKDVTHSWLGDFNVDNADYYIASLHKWFEIPDGGMVASSKHSILDLDSNHEQKELIDLFVKLYRLKNKYFATGNEEIKSMYRPILPKIGDVFDNDKNIYSISKLSRNVISMTNFENIKNKRRDNYSTLLKGLKDSEILKPVFDNLDEDVTPLYFTIYINGERRDLQNMLADNDIYCPVIWPTPKIIADFYNDDSLSHFERILSIPCDQRYDQSDMMRIIECIRKYEENTNK